MKFDIEEVSSYINNSSIESKIYIGGDSERYRANNRWYANYATVVIIHKDGKHGAKVFGEITKEIDYDTMSNKPTTRLMNEVIKIANLYTKLEPLIGERICEIHLDINPDERYVSSRLVNQAIGYIQGVCNKRPKIKPEAFAASCCADRLISVMNT